MGWMYNILCVYFRTVVFIFIIVVTWRFGRCNLRPSSGVSCLCGHRIDLTCLKFDCWLYKAFKNYKNYLFGFLRWAGCAIFCVWFFGPLSSSLILLVLTQRFGWCILRPSSGVFYSCGHRHDSTQEIIFKAWLFIIQGIQELLRLSVWIFEKSLGVQYFVWDFSDRCLPL